MPSAIRFVQQSLADQIVSGQITALTLATDGTVTEFFLLWNHRFNAAWTSAEDLTLSIEASEQVLTKEQKKWRK